jgi:hypothetical protein
MSFSENKRVDFFMGANSPGGFCSLYGELTRPAPGTRRFLIKGGAGTGKSSLMRRAADAMAGRESLLEQIHCSSDPNSLDGLIFHDGHASIVDATPPHVIEPAYPGGFETVVNLCEFFDEGKLESRLARTVELQTANNDCHRKCRGLLKCADILSRDSALYVEQFTDFGKIDTLARRLCQREIPQKAGAAEERLRFLSAVTNQGIVCYSDTVHTLCDRVYLIRDEYGVASSALLQEIRRYLAGQGYAYYACFCPLSPGEKLEHLLIPELSLGFVTEDRFHVFPGLKPYRAINFTRFTGLEALRAKRQFLNFNRKAAAELIHAAVEHLKAAKKIHDDLERQYTDAVDFPGVNAKSAEVIAKLARRYPAEE